MDMNDPRFPGTSSERRMTFDAGMAQAQNAAINGRLFCLMMFALALAMFVQGYGQTFALFAFAFAAAVGFSVIADMIRSKRASLGLTVYSAALSVLFFFSIFGA